LESSQPIRAPRLLLQPFSGKLKQSPRCAVAPVLWTSPASGYFRCLVTLGIWKIKASYSSQPVEVPFDSSRDTEVIENS
ncbi:hypothetical protein J6590_103069, partial [Homalodisca vitripennis]